MSFVNNRETIRAHFPLCHLLGTTDENIALSLMLAAPRRRSWSFDDLRRLGGVDMPSRVMVEFEQRGYVKQLGSLEWTFNYDHPAMRMVARLLKEYVTESQEWGSGE